MSAGILCIERDGLLELFDCFVQKARFSIGSPEKNMNFGPAAQSLEHTAENLAGGRKLLLFELRQRESIANVKIFGRKLQSKIKLARRLAKFPKHEINLAEHVMRRRASRICGEDFL